MPLYAVLTSLAALMALLFFLLSKAAAHDRSIRAAARQILQSVPAPTHDAAHDVRRFRYPLRYRLSVLMLGAVFAALSIAGLQSHEYPRDLGLYLYVAGGIAALLPAAWFWRYSVTVARDRVRVTGLRRHEFAYTQIADLHIATAPKGATWCAVSLRDGREFSFSAQLAGFLELVHLLHARSKHSATPSSRT